MVVERGCLEFELDTNFVLCVTLDRLLWMQVISEPQIFICKMRMFTDIL